MLAENESKRCRGRSPAWTSGARTAHLIFVRPGCRAWIREPRIFIYGSSTGACTRLDSGHKMANDLAAPSSPVARC
ncbi:MAG: hypothetical protein K8963_05540, partial [Proteobacteria bacterium]|nr:hypothetical protein [Pseudomonadota bacterium]